MKNELWIDRVYKEKTESWIVPLDTEHWEQAAALIDTQNQNRKKRLIWFWVAGLVLVTGLSGVLFTQVNGKEVNTPQGIPVQPVTEPMAHQELPILKGTENGVKEDHSATGTNPESPNAISTNSSPENIQRPLNQTKAGLPAPVNRQKIQNHLSKVMSDDNKALLVEKDRPAQPTANRMEEDNLATPADKSGTARKSYAVAALPSDFELAESQARDLHFPEFYTPIPINIKSNKWKEFGLRLGFAKQTQAVRTNAISALGLELYSQKQLGGKGYWGLSLGYNSFFNSSLYSEVLTAYQFKGFGSVVQNFGVKPEWMHYLYVQASMGIQLKKHRAFMGLKPELLLGALGKVDQLKFKESNGIKDLATAEASSIGNGWLEKGALHQVLFNTQLGYEYQFHPRISVGVQAHRQLNSLYKPLPGDISQTNIAKWNIGMRVSYKFK